MNPTSSCPEEGQPAPGQMPTAEDPDADNIRRIRRGMMEGTYDSASVIEEVAARIAESGDL